MSQLQPHRGGMILAFGILGLVLCFPFGLAAWFMGKTDIEGMNNGTVDPEGRGLVDAGRIIGLIGGLLGVIGILLGVLWIGCVVMFGAAGVANG